MEKFLEPEIQINKFEAEDIIATSNDMPVAPDEEEGE